MYGIIEIISLLLGLTGFGLHANSKAPTADTALEYAMVDPDVSVHVDLQTIIPGNYKALVALPDQPAIKQSPDLQKQVREVVGQIEGARGAAKAATGIDMSTDVYDATMFLSFAQGQKEPTWIAEVHGKFDAKELDKAAGMLGSKVQKVDSGSYVESPDHKTGIGLTKSGVGLAGTPSLVKDRLADKWKAPDHKSGNLAHVATVIDGKPVYAVVVTLGSAAKKMALSEIGGQNFATDVIGRHKLMSFAVYTDGIGWSWIDSSKAGLESMAQFSDGAIDLIRAAQIAPRGFAKMALAGLESYRGTDKKVDELLRHKDDLMKIVESYTGDGSFQKKVDKDPAKLSLTVRLTGKSLSDVLPVGAILPAMAVGVLTMGRAKSSSVQGHSSVQPTVVAPPPPPPPHH